MPFVFHAAVFVFHAAIFVFYATLFVFHAANCEDGGMEHEGRDANDKDGGAKRAAVFSGALALFCGRAASGLRLN